MKPRLLVRRMQQLNIWRSCTTFAGCLASCAYHEGRTLLGAGATVGVSLVPEAGDSQMGNMQTSHAGVLHGLHSSASPLQQVPDATTAFRGW